MGYLYYCPRCGEVCDEEDFKRNSWVKGKCFRFCGILIQPKMLPTKYKYWDLYNPKEPKTLDSIKKKLTPTIYQRIWEEYVDVPSNPKLNRIKHEELKAALNKLFEEKGTMSTLDYLEKMGRLPSQQREAANNPKCPKCGSTAIATMKKGFGLGKAAAGAAAVGPYGALAGGVGANKPVNVCQNCGHQWEPGK